MPLCHCLFVVYANSLTILTIYLLQKYAALLPAGYPWPCDLFYIFKNYAQYSLNVLKGALGLFQLGYKIFLAKSSLVAANVKLLFKWVLTPCLEAATRQDVKELLEEEAANPDKFIFDAQPRTHFAAMKSAMTDAIHLVKFEAFTSNTGCNEYFVECIQQLGAYSAHSNENFFNNMMAFKSEDGSSEEQEQLLQHQKKVQLQKQKKHEDNRQTAMLIDNYINLFSHFAIGAARIDSHLYHGHYHSILDCCNSNIHLFQILEATGTNAKIIQSQEHTAKILMPIDCIASATLQEGKLYPLSLYKLVKFSTSKFFTDTCTQCCSNFQHHATRLVNESRAKPSNTIAATDTEMTLLELLANSTNSPVGYNNNTIAIATPILIELINVLDCKYKLILEASKHDKNLLNIQKLEKKFSLEDPFSKPFMTRLQDVINRYISNGLRHYTADIDAAHLHRYC